MKKLYAILFITAIIFTTTACGNKKDNIKETTETHVTEAVETQDLPEDAIVNEDGTWTEHTETVTLPETVTQTDEKTGHTHTYTGVTTKEATCIAKGIYTYTCSDCKDSYTKELPLKGHTYQSTKVSATATQQGYTSHKCVVCGYETKTDYTPATGTSNAGSNNSKNNGTTNNHAHSYTLTKEVKATCKSEGYKLYTCACGDSYKTTYAAGNHTWVQETGVVHHDAVYETRDITETWVRMKSGAIFGDGHDVIGGQWIIQEKYANLAGAKIDKIKEYGGTVEIDNSATLSKDTIDYLFDHPGISYAVYSCKLVERWHKTVGTEQVLIKEAYDETVYKNSFVCSTCDAHK